MLNIITNFENITQNLTFYNVQATILQKIMFTSKVISLITKDTNNVKIEIIAFGEENVAIINKEKQ